MLSHKNVSVFSLTILTAVVLANFQNCAPAKAPSVQASSSSNSGGEARVIDDFNKTEIQFATNEVQLRDELPAADVGGLCNRSHNGAKLKWTIWATAGSILASGDGSCAGGQFDLHLTGLDQMVCGVNHQLVVQGDWGGSTNVVIQQRCQPLASEDLSASNMPAGTECSLEYIPVDEGHSPCSQACYRQGQLVSQTYVDVGQCSSLMARLAGP